MKKKWMIGSVVVFVAALAVSLPMLAWASSIDSKLQIGFALHFTGPDSTAGTFIASGAIEDSGSSVATGVTLTPLGHQSDAKLSGTQVFAGAEGTITVMFKGLAGPLTSPHQTGRGTFEIVSGTGTYADLKGHGTFLIVVDTSTNQLIGTVEGQTN
jgi:hypothetical protein